MPSLVLTLLSLCWKKCHVKFAASVLFYPVLSNGS